jgi:hypothetical protein
MEVAIQLNDLVIESITSAMADELFAIKFHSRLSRFFHVVNCYYTVKNPTTAIAKS